MGKVYKKFIPLGEKVYKFLIPFFLARTLL